MTPRQLLALTDMHREFTSPEAPPEPQPKAPANQGSAGWLMALSQGLERSRPPSRVG
jgi:hypothetical protein